MARGLCCPLMLTPWSLWVLSPQPFFLGRDAAEIIHCWHYGRFSISLFGDLLPTTLFGWLASQFGEVACLGVLCSSIFLAAISNTQSAWRRAKQHSLASMLPSKAHHSQLHHSAWATHVQIASYAEAHKVRVILLTVDHQRVLHFVPS